MPLFPAGLIFHSKESSILPPQYDDTILPTRQYLIRGQFAYFELFMYKLKIKGHVTDFGKSVHVPDFSASSIKSR